MHKFLLILSSFLVSYTLLASDYNATAFSCSSDRLLLNFHIDINDNIDQFSYVDRNVFWHADDIIKNNLTYIVKAQGIDNVISNNCITLSMQLQFSLPEERKVIRRQTG